MKLALFLLAIIAVNSETVKVPPKHQNLTFAPSDEHKKGTRPCDGDCMSKCDDDCHEKLFQEITSSTHASCKIIAPIMTFEKYIWCQKINGTEYCGHQPLPNTTSTSANTNGNRMRRFLNTQEETEAQEMSHYPKSCTSASDSTTCKDSFDKYNTFSCQAKPQYAPENSTDFICMNVKPHPPIPEEAQIKDLDFELFSDDEGEGEDMDGDMDDSDMDNATITNSTISNGTSTITNEGEELIEDFEDDFDPSEEELGEWFFEISADCEEHIQNTTQNQNIKQFLNCTSDCIDELWVEKIDGENNGSTVLKLSIAIIAGVLLALF